MSYALFCQSILVLVLCKTTENKYVYFQFVISEKMYLYNTATRSCEISRKIVKYNRSLGQGLLFRHHANWLV